MSMAGLLCGGGGLSFELVIWPSKGGLMKEARRWGVRQR